MCMTRVLYKIVEYVKGTPEEMTSTGGQEKA